MDDIKISKSLSYLLRHNAIKDNVKITSDGWININDCLKWLNSNLKKQNSINIDDIKRIVNNDNKKRYSLNENNTMIKANQGHSMALNIKLRKITLEDNIEYVVHGSYFKCLNLIKKNGLSKMKRQYIHFALDVPNNDSNVISGMRDNCEILIWINVKELINDGFEFYISDNGVILSEGKDGIIPPKYLNIKNR